MESETVKPIVNPVCDKADERPCLPVPIPPFGPEGWNNCDVHETHGEQRGLVYLGIFKNDSKETMEAWRVRIENEQRLAEILEERKNCVHPLAKLQVGEESVYCFDCDEKLPLESFYQAEIVPGADWPEGADKNEFLQAVNNPAEVFRNARKYLRFVSPQQEKAYRIALEVFDARPAPAEEDNLPLIRGLLNAWIDRGLIDGIQAHGMESAMEVLMSKRFTAAPTTTEPVCGHVYEGVGDVCGDPESSHSGSIPVLRTHPFQPTTQQADGGEKDG